MKLFRFGESGKEKPGIVLNDTHYDVSAFGEDYGETFFETNGITRLSEWVDKNKSSLNSVREGERLGSCVARPSKIICVGLNYTKHALESKMPLPSEPIIFFKSTTALCGPNDNLVIPRNSTKTDWEVELAVIIGKKAT
ncbi:MAG: fumarylacetoacetate hydrolase family protein, partial [Cyclobacteriaceae bacterium]|nr:fumarylacetoacetate hydrolase family protein [Cyclobacteriaceae bacterium]